jgi:hypothetical protein
LRVNTNRAASAADDDDVADDAERGDTVLDDEAEVVDVDVVAPGVVMTTLSNDGSMLFCTLSGGALNV